MSSTDSSSTDAGGPAQDPGSPLPSGNPSKKASALAAIVTLALLAILVWGLIPRQPKLKPAPLEPPRSLCAPSTSDFVPSNLTKIPTMNLDKLPQAAKNRVLLRLNMEPCSCGCKQSLAACRAGNPSCPVAPQAADAIVRQETAETAPANVPAQARDPQ
jgi:hypothetical protein